MASAACHKITMQVEAIRVASTTDNKKVTGG